MQNIISNEILVQEVQICEQNINLKEILTRIELIYIQEALKKANGVVAHAAKNLGLRRTTLIEKMKKFNIVNTTTTEMI